LKLCFRFQLEPLHGGIPNNVVVRSRSLALEFQSFITKTHALRKVFISVKVGTAGSCSHVIGGHLT
jgi:hypothetical protein